MLTVNFGKMKNLQGSDSREKHTQLMFPHANDKFCPLAAFSRQLTLLPSKGPDDAFFLGGNRHSKVPSSTAAKPGTFKGMIEWTREVIGRPVTFRDCARKAVFTRLVNKMGAHDAARAVGVVPRTMDRYHVAQPMDVAYRAAKILAQVDFMPP